ncbi:MAG: hypothetical protein HKN15_13950 [Xanthomonadales bacterium]|nr:hypothetical protein [Xanthomonadales bacterium]
MADAAAWQQIAGLASERCEQGSQVLLVCSALAGTTGALLAIEPSTGITDPVIMRILRQHAELAKKLGLHCDTLLEEFEGRLERALKACAGHDSPANRAALVALGEWASTRIGHQFLSGKMSCEWVDARDALTVVDEPFPDSGRAWLSARCETGADNALNERWSGLATVLITQGYVAAKGSAGTALLGRGGSDISAALLASRLSATEAEIWTDVPGLFSADPSFSPEALLIRELDYIEALEMAASGARVVHPRCIRAAAESGIALNIGDLSRPGCGGTRINGNKGVLDAPTVGVKAVTCQRGMLVMLLENLDSRQQVGFLAWAFDVISALGVSIDLVATSETTTTVAINNVDNHIDQALLQTMTDRLSERCRLRLFADSCCVNLVGRGVRTALAQLGPAAGLIEEQPLLMLSQSANDMCLSFLVYPEHAEALVDELHRHLVVEGTARRTPGIYGKSWLELGGQR